MNACEICGNEYDSPLIVERLGMTHIFDCFECAIYKLAPSCFHCKVRVLGHGVQADNMIFCSAHCARKSGKMGLHDRVPDLKII